jgi:hypothetical protein
MHNLLSCSSSDFLNYLYQKLLQCGLIILAKKQMGTENNRKGIERK